MELALFNSDILLKIATYLPVDGLRQLSLTCRRFGIGCDDSLSLIEETARRVVQDIATEEEMAALPAYDRDNWLCKYNFLLSVRIPLAFDQLVGPVDYAYGNKNRVSKGHVNWPSATAFSNNIMMAGKHYVSFETCFTNNHGGGLSIGVMRPGEAMQNASENPLLPEFYEHFTQRSGSPPYSTVNCCMYSANGHCYSHSWRGRYGENIKTWNGMEGFSGSCTIGMLLDLDVGTLSVYKNGRKLGVMKRRLTGQYCWAVAMEERGSQVTIKRGTVPAS